ncbi:DUF3108 domain-containing protein [Abyssalbus ytuae]|uniref:DUF3108 domain-containing protein n=1 Tax=Abyssalbus ytuae TaxID=2926907 RepID=A0A9E7D2Z9_9FLAO|nr:DUF3108 domain-containing protein [Abyssalbus ytuae]UOB17259.1 DUF3108 domain-containing protein [Abyssalbus ytuae]
MKPTLLIITAFLCMSVLNAQNNTSITSNEKLVYDVSYNMSDELKTQVARLTMETSPVTISGSPLIHLQCKALTYDKWNNYFKIRDLYESYVDSSNLKPFLFKKIANEGGNIQEYKYVYNYEEDKIIVSNKTTSKDQALKPEIKDIISTIYNLRNLDFTQLKTRETFPVKFLFEGQEYSLLVKLLGKGKIGAGPLGTKQCYKLAVGNSEEELKSRRQNIIWLTADAKKIPVEAILTIPLGSGHIKLISANGI